MNGKVSSASVWEILNVHGGQQTQEQNKRIADAMRQLGWRRANTARTIKLDGKNVTGWVRGDQPWRPIGVQRDRDSGLRVYYDDTF
jgi:hypothetical protein